MVLSLGTAGLALVFGSVPLPGDGALTWEAPRQHCPDAAHIVALLEEHTAGTSIGTKVHAIAQATELAEGGWAIELSLRTDAADATTRSFRVQSCEAGAQAVALAISIAMSPEQAAEIDPPGDAETSVIVPPPEPATEDGTTNGGSGEQVPTVAAPPVPDDGTRSAAPPRDARRVRAVIGLAGGVTGGVLPRAGGLLAVYGGVTGPRWRVALHVQHEIRHEFSLSTRPDGSGRISLYGAAIEAGPVLRPGPLEIPLTGGIAAAGLRAVGRGASRNHTRTVPWVGLFAAAGLLWAPMPRLAFGIRGEIVASLVRHTFAFAPTFPLVATGWVAGRGLAVIEVRFP